MHQRIHHFSIWLCLMLAGLAPVGAAEIAVIVNPNNPVSAMTAREVSDLYLGRSRSFVRDEQKILAAVYETAAGQCPARTILSPAQRHEPQAAQRLLGASAL